MGLAETQADLCQHHLQVEILGKTVEPLLARAAHADAESRALAAVRDMLLPRLMSGPFDALGTRVA